ncbi:MAG TPA: hypothetical protein VMW58_02150 [Anaerolineae bacterium]|nr:hypothetical protein [Anaerolineae bacterium]
MAQGSRYTDEDIERGLQALVETGGNAAEASRRTEIPATTLRGWKATKFRDEFVEVRREKRSSLIDEVWKAAQEAVNALRIKIPRMGVNDLLRTFSAMSDKGLAISGEAVNRLDITSGDRPLEGMSDEEKIERLFSIVDKARARRDGGPAGE